MLNRGLEGWEVSKVLLEGASKLRMEVRDGEDE